jgi:hypothetical protein
LGARDPACLLILDMAGHAKEVDDGGELLGRVSV